MEGGAAKMFDILYVARCPFVLALWFEGSQSTPYEPIMDREVVRSTTRRADMSLPRGKRRIDRASASKRLRYSEENHPQKA
jgi:hypothetical protein